MLNIGRRRISGYLGRRLYSKKPSNIDEFNKSKTSYSFGHNFHSLDELEEQTKPKPGQPVSSADIHSRIRSNFDNEDNDINRLIESDPRLLQLRPGSPDYKEMLAQVHREYEAHQAKARKRFERNERLKGIGLGLILLVTIVSGHHILTNYNFYRSKFYATYVNQLSEDTKAQDLADPKVNTKSTNYLVEKLSKEIDNDGTIPDLKGSKDVAGLYVCGSTNGKKLPVRLSFFDNMLIKDVTLLNDYLIVVLENGQVYQFHAGLKEPVRTKLPSKIESCAVSNNTVYYLTNKGELLYNPRLDKQDKVDFEPLKSRWPLLAAPTYNKISTLEKVKSMAAGENHLLLLSKSGRVSIVNTTPGSAASFKNLGQYGLPDYSPLGSSSLSIPVNQELDMKLLNNEIYTDRNGTKTLKPRTFTSIAAGKYHNIVADSLGNIWTWGQNVHGECGIDITYKTDFQPVPRRVLSDNDYKRISSSIIPKTSKPSQFKVHHVYASNESSYVELEYHDDDNTQNNQDLLISFGNGIKGQLGLSSYVHVNSQPQLIKSITKLSEFNEKTGRVENIGIKNVSIGNSHGFITLDNSGTHKDLLAFGDNEFGQLGNGKRVKTSKPIQIPQLIEPSDVEDGSKKKLAKRLNNIINTHMQLLDNHKLANGKAIEQVVVAGENASAIFYQSK